MSLGLPILAAAPGEAADLVSRAEAGVTVNPGDPGVAGDPHFELRQAGRVVQTGRDVWPQIPTLTRWTSPLRSARSPIRSERRWESLFSACAGWFGFWGWGVRNDGDAKGTALSLTWVRKVKRPVVGGK